MKRKTYLIIIVVAAIVCGNIYFSSRSTPMSNLLLANVEALATNFEWEGTKWDTNHHDYNDIWGTSKWTPTLIECTVTYGINAGLVYEISNLGHKVVCTTGSGNCVDGTGCSAG